jgi:hypothetical protein
VPTLASCGGFANVEAMLVPMTWRLESPEALVKS